MPASLTSGAARYWHTLRHLKPVQIYGRAWHRLHRPAIDRAPATGFRGRIGQWVAPAARQPMMMGPRTFRILNHEGSVGVAADWNNSDQAKLWLYNLHYFDDLNAADSKARRDWHRALITRWITENPPPAGNGWEPYPLSLRIVNWIKWALAGNPLDPKWQHSLAVQIRYLARRLEWHLLGNHLFANGKALVFAGLFFEGEEADRWLTTGLAILTRETPEQILPDGGHFELSPMYHSIILEDILDLINLGGAYGERIAVSQLESWRQTARRMLDWLVVMCHPDGQIAFFNDAAFAIAAEPQLLANYAQRLGLGGGNVPREGVTHLKGSGYVRVQRGDMVALLDVARIGPDYIPGHAHADTLSFELSLCGERVFVNSGISQYGMGIQRHYERSTAAHNTVEIDGESSSEVWGGFRVARRAKPFGLRISERLDAATIECAHDGYQRLSGRATHQRQWRFNERSLEVTDKVTGSFKSALARLHFHPAIEAVPVIRQEETTGRGRLRLAGGKHVEWQVTGGHCTLAPCDFYPEFGIGRPSQCLVLDMAGPEGTLTLNW